ncbi:MAG: bifunctional DNA primase/polymerase [Nitrososphaerota archaeon]
MLSASDPLELYISRGLTPIPLEAGGKSPTLQNWPNVSREETLRVFESSMNCNLGIKLEPPLFVIDIDDKRLPPLILDEVTSPTWVVETRRGIHIYLKAPEGHYPTTNKKSRLIQLLGEKCQVVAPPSIVDGHVYRFLYDPHKTPIAEVSSEKLKLLERIVKAFGEHEAMILRFAELWTEGHRHNLSLWLNGALRKSGIERFEAATIIKSICLLAGDSELRDRLRALADTYEKPIEDIGAWSYLKRELETIVGPERASEILKTLPVKIEEEIRHEHEATEKNKKIKLSKPIKIDDVLIEPVECGLVVCKNGHIEIFDTYEYENHVLVKDPWLDGVVVLPPEPIDIDQKELWEATRDFIKRYVYLQDERLYDVVVSFIAWTYFYDRNSWTPYLFIHGPYGSGKTRLLEVLHHLCYRAVLSSIARGPSLFRTIEKLDSLTLLIDEVRIRDLDVLDVLKTGYRRGNIILRADKSGDGITLRKFQTYCVKVFASTNEPTQDLKDRSIIIKMIKTLTPLEKKIDEELARKIRGGWLGLRLRNELVVTGEEYRSIYSDARLEEILSPLLAITMKFNQDAEKVLLEYFRELEEIKASEVRNTPEAEVLEAIRSLIEKGEKNFIEVREIAEALGNSISNEKVGRIMSRLGFRRIRVKKTRGYVLDMSLLERLMKVYLLNPSIEVYGDGF